MQIVYPDADAQILNLFSPELKAALSQLGNLEIYEGRPSTVHEYVRRVGQAEVILLGWGLPNQVMEACQGLKLISFTGTGVENFVDIQFASEHGIAVTYTPHYGDNAVAEHTLALMMGVAKHLCSRHSMVKRGVWDQSIKSIELKGKTIGIVGYGGIGERVASLCKAVGMEVLVWTRRPDLESRKLAGVRFVGLEELLKNCDIISLHLPLTRETKGIIGPKEMSLLKPGVIFINTARAELMDTDAFIEALRSGRIAGAGLDVFDKEPLPEDSPLREFDNLILTPHVGFNTSEAIRNMLVIAVENIIKFYNNQPMNLVNPQILRKEN